MMSAHEKSIQVWAHWHGMGAPQRIGILDARPMRGKEVFSFQCDEEWLRSPFAQKLDPELDLLAGPQYVRDEARDNFGMFLDSSPDRWGRVLMQRREAAEALVENRKPRELFASDYLLGVYDNHRMGALRFSLTDDDKNSFLDDRAEFATPPMAYLRELEHAAWQIENDDAVIDRDYLKWLKLLLAPGGSLGGARPKASVYDDDRQLWIAKFPSRSDEINKGKWEYLTHRLAQRAGIEVAEARVQRFTGAHDTFLTRRFDRTADGASRHSIGGARLHFASAMTLLGKNDGDGADTGVGYLDLVDFICREGAEVEKNLAQLWRRIIFNICVSNTDDHLRNHGFLLTDRGWVLSPAYDMNPEPGSEGLKLNITKTDNRKSLDLAREAAPLFRVDSDAAAGIIDGVVAAVGTWRDLAGELALPRREIERMGAAFLENNPSKG